MGNRAVISIGRHHDNAMGIYLHWNGGRDSVEAFLDTTKRIMKGRDDGQYATARLIQVIGNFFGEGTSLGVDLCKNLDCDNHDNGVYEVDPEELTIIGREFYNGTEQQEYDLETMVQSIMEKMPNSYKAIGKEGG